MYGEVQIVRRPDGNAQVWDDVSFAAQAATLSAPAIEVTDFPEFTRDQTARNPPMERWAKKRKWDFISRLFGDYNAGMTLPIMALPPATDPVIPIQKFWEIPIQRLTMRRRWQVVAALRTVPDAPGYSPMFIPAVTYNVTACKLLEEIQFHLLETPDDGVTWGSGIWTQAEVVGLINERVSRWLVETGVIQTRITIAVAAGTVGVDLPTDWIEIRRVAWNSVEIPRVTLLELEADMPDWEDVTGVPSRYMEVPAPSLTVRLARAPTLAGTLDVIGVREPTAINASCASIFPIPDEWTPYIKWGVIADLLSKEGEANDPQRASLCETRWKEGVMLARLFLGTEGL